MLVSKGIPFQDAIELSDCMRFAFLIHFGEIEGRGKFNFDTMKFLDS